MREAGPSVTMRNWSRSCNWIFIRIYLRPDSEGALSHGGQIRAVPRPLPLLCASSQAKPHYSVNGLFVELKDVQPLLTSTKLTARQGRSNYDAHNIIERGAYFDREMYAFDTPHYEQIVRPLIEAMNIDLNRSSADYLILRDDRKPQFGNLPTTSFMYG